MNSAVFYDGPSQITGAPILGIVSGLKDASRNKKTGDLAQAWILVKGVEPGTAIASGADDAICGDCSLRGDGKHGRACYVSYWQAPFNIWRTHKWLPRIPIHEFAPLLKGRLIRLGAYGDPVAIPAETWIGLLSQSDGSIGYTQRWDRCDPAYRSFLMASAVSTVARDEARALGWRTFRIRGPRDPVEAGECVCPASHESQFKAECHECMLCSGTLEGDRRASPVIVAHGKPGNLKALGVAPTYPVGRPRKVIPLQAV